MTAVFETERLRLFELTLDDAPFIVRQLNEPSFVRNIADRGVRTVEQAADYLRNGPLASYASHGFGLWRIERKSDGASLGMAGLLQRASLDHPDVGYALLPEHWGEGYASEAAAGCVARARHHYRWPRLMAIVLPTNAPSIRVLERLGFTALRRIHRDPDPAELSLYTLDLVSS